MLRKGILFFVFLALIAGVISCSVWRQLGKMPNDKELSDFVSSEPVSYTHLTLPTTHCV